VTPSRVPVPEHAFIGAGDPSGDLLASALVRGAGDALSDVKFWGFGGAHLADAGVALVDRLERFGTSGLLESAGRLPRNARLVGTVIQAAGRKPPGASVLVDYPDVNMILGQALCRAGSRVIYLLPPQVWAWRAGRLALMSGFVDVVAACFPFEIPIYEDAGLRCVFVGHPLLLLDPYSRPPPPTPSPDLPVVAFLPGSRRHEVARVLPRMVAAARLLVDRHPGIVCRLAAAPTCDDVVDRLLADRDRELFELVEHPGCAERTTTVARALDGASAAVVHAGTATLEAAIMAVPSVVVARLSRSSWELARRLVRVSSVAMPSILLGRRIFTERLQDEMQPSTLADDVDDIIEGRTGGQEVHAAALELREMLHERDGAGRFADLVRGTA
jgi:lipid-A-disaccharide synthase